MVYWFCKFLLFCNFSRKIGDIVLKLLVIDGNSIVNRAFYGIKLLSNKNGQYTNAITGFFNMILKLETEYKPDEVAIAFDLKAPTFRHKMYSDYKAHRKGMPEELASQMPILKELLCFLGYNCVSLEGFEADDILGTLAKACEKRGDTCYIATGDRDSLQLVTDTSTVLLLSTYMGKSTTYVMDKAAILEKYNLTPKQLIDVKSLMGDASDNIPGVAGIGEKTALTLIQNFGSLQGVYDNIDDASIKKGAREKLINGKESANVSYELATINCAVPIETNAGAYKKTKDAESLEKAARLFSELEMFTVIKKLALDTTNSGGAESTAEARQALLPPFTLVESINEFNSESAVFICAVPNEATPKTAQGKATKTAAQNGQTELFTAEQTSFDAPVDAASNTTPEQGEKTALELALETAQEGDSAKDKSSAPKFTCVQKNKLFITDENSAEFMALLENENAEKHCFDAKILHHIAFSKGKEAKGITFDAKIAAYLLKPDARDYTISELALSYGVNAEYALANAVGSTGAISNANCTDAAVLEGLCMALLSECDAQGMKSLLFDIEMPLCKVLADMEMQGILVDSDGIAAFGKELKAALEKELSIIHEHVGYEFNVNSPKQLGKALFDDLGLPTGKKTKSGYSTNAETLEKLRKYSPVIDHISLYRTYQKLNSTYIEGLLKVVAEDGRIHTTFNQTETRTGRISSGEPNLQNIPVRTELGSRLRKYFVAGEGNVLLDADYSQIELRILAHISADETMIGAFSRGADIHRSTAAKSYGVSEDEVTAQMRSSAKAVNFGIVYGIGAFSLAKDLDISVKKADEFIKTYFENFPGVKKYLDDTVETAKKDGYVTTLYGRRRNLPELANSNFNVRSLGERMAMNTPIQGTAADIIKLAMVRVYDRLKRENLAAKLILQVHDELIVECPEHEKDKAAQIIAEEMRTAAQLTVPLVADVNSAENWYNAKG